MNIAIPQPMLFPWVGMLEQIVLVDVFVSYVDVQPSKGSFINRVQTKNRTGSRWLTVPLERFHLSGRTDQVRPHVSTDWRGQHLCKLEQAYEEASYAQDTLALVRTVHGADYAHIGALVSASMQAICSYLDTPLSAKLCDSVELAMSGCNSDCVLAIARQLHGSKYITRHDVKNYLTHAEFKQHGITVEYMNYVMLPYRQLHGALTPFVSSLDLIANHDPASKRCPNPQALSWR